jgi:hypothetical protein
MRSKSVLSPVAFVAFIFLFMAAGFAQDYKSEFSVQGTANLPKNSPILISRMTQPRAAAFSLATVII